MKEKTKIKVFKTLETDKLIFFPQNGTDYPPNFNLPLHHIFKYTAKEKVIKCTGPNCPFCQASIPKK